MNYLWGISLADYTDGVVVVVNVYITHCYSLWTQVYDF